MITFLARTPPGWVIDAAVTVALIAALWGLHEMLGRHGLGPLLWRWHSGACLDGRDRTNATWLHRSGSTLHHSGNAVWWHHQPRLLRAVIRCGAELALAAVAAGLLLARPLTLDILMALGSAALAWAAWYVIRHARDLPAWHRRRRAEGKLRHHFGVPVPLAVSRDGQGSLQVRVKQLPRSWAGVKAERDKAVSIICSVFGLELNPDDASDVAWKEAHRTPHVIFTAPGPPPDEVMLDAPRTLDIIRALDKDSFLGGIGRRGAEIARRVNGEATMIGVSMSIEKGKSNAAGIVAAQLARQGSVLAVLDYPKMISHRWARGLPNVAYATRVEQVMTLLTWLEQHVMDRYIRADEHMDAYARLDDFLGPRIVFVAEEMNILQMLLAREWRRQRALDRGLPARCPASEALDFLLFVSRQCLYTGVIVAQRLSVAAMSGAGKTADARDQLVSRWVCDPGEQTWRLIGPPDLPCPVPRNHPGRHYLVSPASYDEVQTIWAGRDLAQAHRNLRALAMSGEVGQPPEGMPFVNRQPWGGPRSGPRDGDGWSWRAEAVPVPEIGPGTPGGGRAPGPDQESVPGGTWDVPDPGLVADSVTAGDQPEYITLREGIALGIIRVPYEAARKRALRGRGHPPAAGERETEPGKPKTYSAFDLACYYEAAMRVRTA